MNEKTKTYAAPESLAQLERARAAFTKLRQLAHERAARGVGVEPAVIVGIVDEAEGVARAQE